MEKSQIDQVRSFNRAVTRRVGALEDSYLSRGRPLGEARLIFEAGTQGGIDLRELRQRLGLDSGYMSRLLRSLEAQGMTLLRKSRKDGRVRELALTDKGRAEFIAYDKASDELAGSLLTGLREAERRRLVEAMAVVERLLAAGSIEIAVEPADGVEAGHCLQSYYSELGERFEAGFDPDAVMNFDPSEMTPPKGWFLVARLEGKAIGCGALKVLEPKIGEVKRVWVDPTRRGLGLATRIMDRLERIGQEEGMTRVRLDTNRALPEARAFYLKRGYREIARYNDNVYADFWFEKEL